MYIDAIQKGKIKVVASDACHPKSSPFIFSTYFIPIDFTDYSLFTQWPRFRVGYLLAFREQCMG